MAVDKRRAEEGLSELLRAYRDAQRIIAGMVAEAVRAGNLERRDVLLRRFAEVQAYLTGLGVETDPVARRLVANAWAEGDRSVTEKLGGSVRFGVINTEAMALMQESLINDLAGARTTLGRRVFDVYRRAGMRATTLGLLGAQGSGRAVSQELVRSLREQGVKGFVDKAGRQWDLKTYANMVARTNTREAVVQAQIQRMADQGIEFARISRSAKPCPICAPWQGVLVSLGDAPGNLKGETAATLDALPNGGPPFHPNCSHYLVPESTMF